MASSELTVGLGATFILEFAIEAYYFSFGLRYKDLGPCQVCMSSDLDIDLNSPESRHYRGIWINPTVNTLKLHGV